LLSENGSGNPVLKPVPSTSNH